jgi:hypothetical protein
MNADGWMCLFMKWLRTLEIDKEQFASDVDAGDAQNGLLKPLSRR